MPDPKRSSAGSSDGSRGANAYLIDGRSEDGVPERFAFLADPEALRRRFVLSEILGTPRALQLRGAPGQRAAATPPRGRR